MFILGAWYFSLDVLWRVFGVRDCYSAIRGEWQLFWCTSFTWFRGCAAVAERPLLALDSDHTQEYVEGKNFPKCLWIWVCPSTTFSHRTQLRSYQREYTTKVHKTATTSGSRGPPAKIVSKSCSFQAILSTFWAQGPPICGQNSAGPP